MHRVYDRCGVRALNHVPSHIYVWQHLTDRKEAICGTTCDTWKEGPEPGQRLPTGSTVSLGWSPFLTMIFLSFDLLSLEKPLKEMLVVIPPCVEVRRIEQKIDTLHCPTLSFTTSIMFTLPAVNYCIWLHLLISPQLVTWFHFSTLLSPKLSTQLHSSFSFITCYFTLIDTAVWFAYSFLKLHGKYLVRKWSGACKQNKHRMTLL